MKRILIVIALCTAAFVSSRIAATQARPAAVKSVSQQLIGSWKLTSRVSKLNDGKVIVDPDLGADPSGVLIYDSSGHMAAQLSRQGRTVEMLQRECSEMASVKTSPNTANTILGYDAYFGTYTVSEKEGVVTHHLEAALWPGNQGKSINRNFTLHGDELTITFKTTTQENEPVTRTLVWHRMR